MNRASTRPPAVRFRRPTPARSSAGRSTRCFRRTPPGSRGRRRGCCWSAPESARTAPPTGCAASPPRPAWRRGSAGPRGWRWCTGPARTCRPGRAVEVLAEGVTLANFEGASLKTAPDTAWLASVELRVGGAASDYAAHVARGVTMGECSNIARTLANEPGNRLTPRIFAERGAALAQEAGPQGGRARRDADRGAEHGAAARRRARQPGAAAAAGARIPAGAAGGRCHARADRQGHHVRHRRHLDQAGREHGQDEGRHVGRRGGDCARCWRSRAWARRSAASASSR